MTAETLDDFSELIGKIYAAALDATLWPEVLKALGAWMTAHAAVLTSYDLLDPGPPWALSVGYEPEYWHMLLQGRFYLKNPAVEVANALGAGESTYFSADPDKIPSNVRF